MKPILNQCQSPSMAYFWQADSTIMNVRVIQMD